MNPDYEPEADARKF